MSIIVKFLELLFKGPPKSGYSIRGFWGQMKHYNKHGVQIGYTIRGFWGQRKRYDMDGNLKSVSWRNFWGGYDTYDADGNRIRRSRRNFMGGYNTYNKNGKKITESYHNFWEGFNHFDVSEPDPDETIKVEKRAVNRTWSDSTKTTSYTKVNSSLNAEDRVDSGARMNTGRVSRRTEKRVTENNVSSYSGNDSLVKPSVSSYLNKEMPIKGKENVAFDEKSNCCEKKNLNEEPKYYSDIKEAVKGHNITRYKKILVFRYKDSVEFPAIVHIDGDMVKVKSIQIGIDDFSFPASEIADAKEETIRGLDMNVMDEFFSCNVSGLGNEFEKLLPEYSFSGSGVERNQYVLNCGMIITEKSLDELQKLCNECST